jgi:Skp family chaperone for outer membrane proteins
MKRVATGMAVLVLAIMVSASGNAESEYYGMGPGMMGHMYGEPTSEADKEKVESYRKEVEKQLEDTADLRQNIWVKQHEMSTLLASPKTSKKELLEKQKELQKLMNELQRKELAFRWELDKKFPEMAPDMYGGCYGPAMGHGMGMACGGPGMMGYGGHGYGPGMMGHGGHGYGHGMMMGPGWGRKYWRGKE